MKSILESLFAHQTLNRREAEQLLGQIAERTFNDAQIAAFLTVFRVRGITLEELAGFRDALQDRCVAIDLRDFDPIDLCGTGGDGKDTFNISTLSSFVVAGAGINVAKHGNYSVSSSCGSSNVLEALGYRFTADPDLLKKQIEQSGICFLHAPLFHPAMKAVGPVRRSLGVHTFFNMLGPMVNPGFPKRQLVGVFSLELLRFYQYLYQQSDGEFRIVHSLDGYDEISLTGMAKVVSPAGESLLAPSAFGSKPLAPQAISGGTSVAEAVRIFTHILDGKGTKAQNAVVIANSGLAIQCARPELSLEDAMGLARESLESGRAKAALESLLNHALVPL